MIRFIFLVLLGSSLQLIANSEFIGGVKTVYQIVPGSLAEFEDVLNLPWYKYEITVWKSVQRIGEPLQLIATSKDMALAQKQRLDGMGITVVELGTVTIVFQKHQQRSNLHEEDNNIRPRFSSHSISHHLMESESSSESDSTRPSSEEESRPRFNGTAKLGRIAVGYPSNRIFYMLGLQGTSVNSPTTPTTCLSIDNYVSGRQIEGATLGSYTSCNFYDRGFQFEFFPLKKTDGDTFPGKGDWTPSDCVQIRNRYSGGCLTIANTYQPGYGGHEIAGSPVTISGCGEEYENLGKAVFQAWKIGGKGSATPWIESCSLPTKKYLTRRQTGVQAASNLYLDPWNNYWYQGWNFLQLEPKDVNTSTQAEQYGCGSSGACWSGGARSKCGSGKWCYTSNHKFCSTAADCISEMDGVCVFGYDKCTSL